jgi:hypothetical protein
MKVKELIEHLKTLPQDAKMIISTNIGYLELHRLPVFDRAFELDNRYHTAEPYPNYVEIKDWEDIVIIDV